MEPPHYSRFSYPSATNQQAALWIISIICPIYSVLILGIRYSLRRKIKKSDIILGAGYLLAVVDWGFVWTALLKGAGKSRTVVSAANFADASRFVYGSVAVSMLIVATTTASQCFFVSELVSNRKQVHVCFWAAGVGVILALAALLTILPGCSSSRYLYHGGSPDAACSAQSTRWIIGGVLLGLATSVPAALPPLLFHDLQTTWRRKMNIYLIFGTTLLSIPLIVLLVVYFNFFNHSDQDSTTAVRFVILLQILLVWCFASTTIPCSRPVALKFSTSRAQLQDPTLYGTGTKGSGSKNGSNPRGTTRKGENQSLREQPQLRDDVFEQQNRVMARGQQDETASVASYGSERQFIRKTVAVTLQTDEV